jgi:inositol-phosphate phosphatase/L-galactose 1-phosphate phosphatase/histidinol-phosphatase
MPGEIGLAELLQFAHRLADAAGQVVRRYYRTPVTVETKPDASPVTIADREAEQAMRTLIREAFPDHGVEGEEFGAERVDAPFVWCLDPIDGTKSFITGRPLFGTLISLVRDGQPILGVIDQCVLQERWVGAAGQPSTWNGARRGDARGDADGERRREPRSPNATLTPAYNFRDEPLDRVTASGSFATKGEA